jgi:hypothetical protein
MGHAMLRIRAGSFVVAVLVVVSSGLYSPSPSWADDAGAGAASPATPIFTPAAGAIVSGLSGLVTGTQTALTTDRTTERIMVFRTHLATLLLNAPAGANKIALGSLNPPGNTEYAISNQTVLCNVRGAHAVAAADATYINAVTGTLDKFATPPKIQSISDALGSLFQNYSISAPPGLKDSDTAAGIVQSCMNDINNWPASVYGQTIAQGAAAAPAQAHIDIGDGLSAIFTLYQAVVALITPIVVTPAQVIDQQRRANAIKEFLDKYPTTILNAAANLAADGTMLATQSRLQALGQFAEKMSEFRTGSIDLTKISACADGLKNPVLRTVNGTDAKGNPTTYSIPSDAFVVCYEQAWAQILNAVQAAVTAAAQYDALADVSSDQLSAAVKTIHDNFTKLNQAPGVDVSQLWTAAAQLVAYGQAVSQAVTPDNIAKVETDVNNVMKAFGKK